MIILNQKMMPILKGQPISSRLSKGLATLLREGIVENSQCFFFRRFYVSNPHITIDLFDDMTAYECFINNIHIEDFCRKNVVSNALVFVNRLENLLRKMNVGYEIILTIQKDSCTLTFHSLHKSEVRWIDFSRIEDYKCGIAIFRSQDNCVDGF